jgi:hydroxymethylglutaryl-CoA synthase
MKLFVPRPRIRLEDWCAWTGNEWSKIRSVVGSSFRMIAPHESIYTMAANAVLRLILDYQIDPERVGYLGFGTESSTDNACGSIIVKGLVDKGLRAHNLSPLARNCEVPEIKHACLGGSYAAKAAARYLALDGRGRQAIVVCGDIAEYERGSTGEQTQGAGAMALLLENDPKLYSMDLQNGGSSSDYRGPDFRKPFRRHFTSGYTEGVQKMHDFPVFSGRYSTFCYIDETLRAIEDMAGKLGTQPQAVLDGVDAFFFHRPYQNMPIMAMSAIYAWALASSESHLETLRALCNEAGVSVEAVRAELNSRPNLLENALAGRANKDPMPEMTKVSKTIRSSGAFKDFVGARMVMGHSRMAEIGNIYTAAMPAWIASGLDEAAAKNLDLAAKRLLAIGYGSGDAADAVPLFVADGWRQAASKIRFDDALANPVDVTKDQYEALHDRGELPGASISPRHEFVVDRIGKSKVGDVQDVGIEYYEYVP